MSTLKVGAYYYGWYDSKKWREPISNQPIRGQYSSHSPELIQEHINDARRAGIDYFILSWTPGRDKNLLSVLDGLDQNDFPYILQYESGMALELKDAGPIQFNSNSRLTNTRVGELFQNHMEIFIRDISRRPQYFHVDRRPMIIFYVARDYFDANNDVSQIIAAPIFFEKRPLWIADVVYWNRPEDYSGRLNLKLFDGFTAYNMYAGHLKEDMKNYLTHIDRFFGYYHKFSRNTEKIFIPNFQPGYDDRALRGQQRPVVLRNNGKFFEQSFSLAVKHKVGINHIFLTSFNEWFEGTEIEPSIQYQDQYLRKLCEMKMQYNLRQQNWLYRYYRRFVDTIKGNR